MTPLKIASGGVAMFVLLVVFAVQRIPSPADAAEEEERFDEAWIDIMRPLALKNADLGRGAYIPVSTESKNPVADAERIITPAPDGAPASMPPVVVVQDEVDKPTASLHRRQHASNGHRTSGPDVCTRHRMRKVVTRGGKSWSCRR